MWFVFFRAQHLCEKLKEEKWAVTYICSDLDQKERLKILESLRNGSCRVLISTDLFARGIDAELTDLVINLDVPWDSETYLHRIGRAGRFGKFSL